MGGKDGLARILHEGGHMMDNLPARCAQAGIFIYINDLNGSG